MKSGVAAAAPFSKWPLAKPAIPSVLTSPGFTALTRMLRATRRPGRRPTAEIRRLPLLSDPFAVSTKGASNPIQLIGQEDRLNSI
jgi:hypothetical protein